MDIRKNVGGRNFGQGLKVSIFACSGISDEKMCMEINSKILNSIKMNTDGLSPKCWNFPTENGKGGNGITLIQPLVESFITWDTWPDNNGAFLFVVSCKEYNEEEIEVILNNYFEIKKKDIIITEI